MGSLVTWVDGRFVEPTDATISVFDAGVQHAIGLFETMLARHGRVFRPLAHLNRLAVSASELLLTESLWTEPLAEAVGQCVERSGLEQARVRLTLTGGDLSGLQAEGRSRQDPTIVITVQPATRYPEAFFEQGVLVTVADGRLNTLTAMAGHKTMNYWERIQTLQLAGSRGASESLWFSITNHLASGCVSNVFLVRDGVLMTPIARGEEPEAAAMRAPVLPGVQRAAIIELAESHGVEVERKMLTYDDLSRADEVFLTNSGWGVLPVVAVEQKPIARGEVGPLTRALREQWQALVDRETREGLDGSPAAGGVGGVRGDRGERSGGTGGTGGSEGAGGSGGSGGAGEPGEPGP